MDKLEALDVILHPMRPENFRGNKLVEAEKIVREALTSPTSKEVCKALKKWYKKQKLFIDKIEYDKKNKAFVNGFFILVNYIDSMLLFEVLLPPYLVTLISRFYEGIEANER